jgi:hypothetical protein
VDRSDQSDPSTLEIPHGRSLLVDAPNVLDETR